MADQAASTSILRAAVLPCFEMRPCRAGPSPDCRTYDGIANLFAVNLQLIDPSTREPDVPTKAPQNPLRFSVTDQTRPAVTRPPGRFIALRQLPGQPGTILRDQFGQPRYFNDVSADPNDPNGSSRAFVEVGTNQRLRTASGTEVRVSTGGGLDPTQEDVTARTVDSAYRAGSVFDVPMRPPDTPTRPAEGAVSQLAGGNGLAATRNAGIPEATPALANITGRLGGVIARDDGVPGTVFSIGEARLTRETAVAPGVSFVTIIDKVTEGNEFITSQRGIQPGERFFAIGGGALPTPASGGYPGAGAATLAPGTVVRYAVSDGLNPLGPDGRPNINQPGGFRADCGDSCTAAQQFLNPAPGFGRPGAFSSFNAFRPEESFVPGAARGDTHLLVTAGQGNRHPAMRVDLQVAANGLSSAGVSVGGLLALPEGGGLALSGATVGSARLGAAGSQAILGSLGSLATAADAYGTHVFPNTDPTIATTRGGGDLGHFAIGESDPRGGAPNRSPPVQPGSVQPVGGGNAVPFGFTRLATNVGAVGGLTRTEDGRALQGFAAGLAEVPRGDGTLGLHAVTGDDPGAVVISRAANANEFTARLRVSPTGLGELSSDPDAAPAATGATGQRVLAFESGPAGTPPTSAFAGDASFAAVVPRRAALASVDADTLAGIAGGAALPPSNQHAAWGLFLGDLVPQGGPGSPPREYVGLGFWVAGRLVDPSVLSTLTGAATYRGGMIGTAAEAGRIATVAGNFTHQWNFAQRAGQFDARFDGRSYTAPVTMPQGTAAFAGTGPSGDRTLAVRGAFFNAGPIAGGAPAAVGGNFGIRGPGYGATGIYIGNR